MSILWTFSEYMLYSHLAVQQSYWTWPFIVRFSSISGDCPVRYLELAQGNKPLVGAFPGLDRLDSNDDLFW